MYIFKLFTVDGDIANRVDFNVAPTRWQIEDLLWYVDSKSSKEGIDELMNASGEDVYFNTVDENGFIGVEDEVFLDGVYATLELR